MKNVAKALFLVRLRLEVQHLPLGDVESFLTQALKDAGHNPGISSKDASKLARRLPRHVPKRTAFGDPFVD